MSKEFFDLDKKEPTTGGEESPSVESKPSNGFQLVKKPKGSFKKTALIVGAGVVGIFLLNQVAVGVYYVFHKEKPLLDVPVASAPPASVDTPFAAMPAAPAALSATQPSPVLSIDGVKLSKADTDTISEIMKAPEKPAFTNIVPMEDSKKDPKADTDLNLAILTKGLIDNVANVIPISTKIRKEVRVVNGEYKEVEVEDVQRLSDDYFLSPDFQRRRPFSMANNGEADQWRAHPIVLYRGKLESGGKTGFTGQIVQGDFRPGSACNNNERTYFVNRVSKLMNKPNSVFSPSTNYVNIGKKPQFIVVYNSATFVASEFQCLKTKLQGDKGFKGVEVTPLRFAEDLGVSPSAVGDIYKTLNHSWNTDNFMLPENLVLVIGIYPEGDDDPKTTARKALNFVYNAN